MELNSLFDENMTFYLIEAVKNNPYIWDFKHPLNKSKANKQKFWEGLVDQINHIYNPPERIIIRDACTKWNGLRSRFALHYKRQIVSSIGNSYTSWLFYKQLEFLIPCIKLQLKRTHKRSHKKRYNNGILNSQKSSNSQQIKGFENQMVLGESFSNMFVQLNANRNHNNSSEDGSNDEFQPLVAKTENEESCTMDLPRSTNDTLSENSLNTESYNQFSTNSLLTCPVAESSNTESPIALHKAGITDTRINNANSTFGMYVGSEIALLDLDLQITAKSQISNLLMELVKKQLNRRVLPGM